MDCKDKILKVFKISPDRGIIDWKWQREGTVLNFNLTFDIAWKVMKDILVKNMGILDFATGSPIEAILQKSNDESCGEE